MAVKSFRSFRRRNGDTPNPPRDALGRVLQVGDLVVWPQMSGGWIHRIIEVAPELRPGAPAGSIRVKVASEHQVHQPPGMVLPLVLIQPALDTEAMEAEAKAAAGELEPPSGEPTGEPAEAEATEDAGPSRIIKP